MLALLVELSFVVARDKADEELIVLELEVVLALPLALKSCTSTSSLPTWKLARTVSFLLPTFTFTISLVAPLLAELTALASLVAVGLGAPLGLADEEVGEA